MTTKTTTPAVSGDARRMLLHAADVFERDALLRVLEARTAAVRAAIDAHPHSDLPGALDAHGDALAAWVRFLAKHPGAVIGRG